MRQSILGSSPQQIRYLECKGKQLIFAEAAALVGIWPNGY